MMSFARIANSNFIITAAIIIVNFDENISDLLFLEMRWHLPHLGIANACSVI